MKNELKAVNGSTNIDGTPVENLVDWYHKGVLDFLNLMSIAPPPEFKNENQYDAQMKAIERVRSDIIENTQ